MNDQSRRPIREAIFEVFRPQGERDESAENYQLKKPTAASLQTGPLKKNHIIDTSALINDQRIEPHALHLSGADAERTSEQPETLAQPVVEESHPPTAIRLETFSISMEQRLGAMQVAQQKAKDQLNEFEKQRSTADEPPIA